MDRSSLTPKPDTTRTASVPIEINCPAWCEVSPEQHAARLYDNEGRCIHQTAVSVVDPAGKRAWDEAPRFCAPFELTLRTTTNPAGREVESADALVNGTESNLEQLRLLAVAISELADLYYGTTGSTYSSEGAGQHEL